MNADRETALSKDVIFNNNPIYMMSLIGKTVEIKLDNNERYTGIVYVVDPIFKTVVIHERPRSDKHYVTRIVLHHAIKSLVVLSDEKVESYLSETQPTNGDNGPEVLNGKRELIKKRFQNMCLNVEESGDCLKIDDNIVILPPYGPENCICSNTLILERIQNILNTPFNDSD